MRERQDAELAGSMHCRFTVLHDAFIVHRPHPDNGARSTELRMLWRNNMRWCVSLNALEPHRAMTAP